MFAQLREKKLQEQKLTSNLYPPSTYSAVNPTLRHASPLIRQQTTQVTLKPLPSNMLDSATISSGTTSRAKLQSNEVIIPRVSHVKKRQEENTSPLTNQTQIQGTNQIKRYNIKKVTPQKQQEQRTISPNLRAKNIELDLTVKPSKIPKTYQCDQSLPTLVRKPTIVSEDLAEIQHFKSKEKKSLICANYLDQHPTLNYKARAILLDWMMELSLFYGLHRETYYLAVNMVDSYLSTISNMPLSYFQLLGAAALFIATKHEEYEPPTTEQLSSATNETFSEEDIVKMEMLVLKGLRFNVRSLTYFFWINYFVEKWILFETNLNNPSAKDKSVLYKLCYSIIDIAQLDSDSLNHKPRETVASLLLLIVCLLCQSLDFQQIQYSLSYSSKYLLQSSSNLILQFKKFLLSNFNMKIVDLICSVQFISSYFFICEAVAEGEEFSVALQSFKRGNLKMVEFRRKFVEEGQ